MQAKTSVILRCDVDVLVIYHMAKSKGANKQDSKKERILVIEEAIMKKK